MTKPSKRVENPIPPLAKLHSSPPCFFSQTSARPSVPTLGYTRRLYSAQGEDGACLARYFPVASQFRWSGNLRGLVPACTESIPFMAAPLIPSSRLRGIQVAPSSYNFVSRGREIRLKLSNTEDSKVTSIA